MELLPVHFISLMTGYYMYIEATKPATGDNAKLVLSVSGNRELSCLTFYYHMYGYTMGTLNVFSGNAVVFNTSGNHGNYWIMAKRTIFLDKTVSFNQYQALFVYRIKTAR